MAKRSLFVLCTAGFLLQCPVPAGAVADVPTSRLRAVDLADLASGSGITAPVDTASLPLHAGPYAEAFRALTERGLFDPYGKELEAQVRARADGALHLEPLVPDVRARLYVLRGADERLLYHSGGETLDRGVNGFVSLGGSAFWGGHVSGAYDFQLEEKPGRWSLGTKRLYVKGELGKWSLKLGRDSVRLGPGYHGSLLLDDNATPLDLWDLRTEEPLFLPGFLSELGGFRFRMLTAYLSDPNPSAPDPRYVRRRPPGEPVEDAGLWAMRLSYHPSSWLDLGLSRTALFGGKGRQTYRTPKDWWKLFSGTDENVRPGEDPRYDNDQFTAVDLTVRFPFLNGLGPLKGGKFYWEYAGTDLIAKWKKTEVDSWAPVQLNDVANLGGVYFSTGVTDLRVEYATTSPPFYNHHVYSQGYTYRGHPLGHHLGPDGRDVFFQVARYLTPSWRLVTALDLEERGRRRQPTPEKRAEWSLALEAYGFSAYGVPVAARLDFLTARVRDALDDPERDDRRETYGGVGVEARF
jgi:hypothetical protein